MAFLGNKFFWYLHDVGLLWVNVLLEIKKTTKTKINKFFSFYVLISGLILIRKEILLDLFDITY